jgi:hypothetical protein
MATLAGNTIASTYPLLIKVDSNGLDGTLRTLQDGDATNSALQISTTAIKVNGSTELDGAVIINESGADVDFRVEGDGNPNALIVNAQQSLVGIGTGTPGYTIDSDDNSSLLDHRGGQDQTTSLGSGGIVHLRGLVPRIIFEDANASGNAGDSPNYAVEAQDYFAIVEISASDTSEQERFRIKSNGSLMSKHVSGVSNSTAFGEDAGIALASGANFNTFFGVGAGSSNTTAGSNTFVGYNCGDAVTTAGNNNVAMGPNALGALTVGDENVAIGDSAMLNAISSTNNVAIGSGAALNFAGNQNDNGEDNNIAIGQQAMRNVNGGDNNDALVRGNIAIGKESLMGGDFTGNDRNLDYNIAIGQDALNSTGTSQLTGVIAIGASAGTAINSNNASACVIIGHQAGMAVTSGAANTLIGHEAGMAISSQTNNTIVGFNAGHDVTGNHNTIVGKDAGALVTTPGSGSSHDGLNTLIGSETGDAITTGKHNTVVGAASDISANSGVNQIVIGYGVVGQGDNYAVIGNGSTTRLYAGDDAGGTFYGAGQSWSDSRIKTNVKDIGLGLDFINKLEPIQYTKKQPMDYDDSLKSKLYPNGSERIIREIEENEIEKIRPGFLAQDVLKTLKEFNFNSNNSMVQIDEDTTQHSMDYQSLVVPLVKAVQELSAKVIELENKLGK